MPDVRISCTLDEELQLCRYVSFVDFIDLLKFGQIRLEDACRSERCLTCRTFSAWQCSACCPHTSGPLDQIQSGDRSYWKKRTVLEQRQESFLLQSWSLMDEAGPDYWRGCQHPEQCIGIVSNVKALAESFLVPDGTDLVIAEASEHPSVHGFASVPSPISVIAKTSRASRRANPELRMNVHVILSTLLSKVFVSPNAPTRFFELVIKLVGENTSAIVARASQPPLEALRM